MFHIITTPLSIIANAVMEDTSNPANIATRQAIELDACTNCGTCSLFCSARSAFDLTGNELVLPAQKVIYLKRMAAGKKLSSDQIKAILERLYLCTNCDRCTSGCPSGIRLNDIWFNARESLFREGTPEALVLSGLSFSRGIQSDRIPQDQYETPIRQSLKLISDTVLSEEVEHHPIRLNIVGKEFQKGLRNSSQGKTVPFCYTCICYSTECPVVLHYDNPGESLDLLPHQIIRAAVYGLGDLAFNSNMLWSCTGCYRCQEVCPQGVNITDVFYELKSLAIRNAKQKSQTSSDRIIS